jgi:hypothetical protein
VEGAVTTEAEKALKNGWAQRVDELAERYVTLLEAHTKALGRVKEMADAMRVLLDENKRLREALVEIARPKRGIEAGDSDAERLDYYRRTSAYQRNVANEALKGEP